MGEETVVRTESLSKDYGRTRALVDVDLEIHRGEVFGYLGPNGAGKTTTIRVLLGLLRPTAGRAAVFGLDSWRESTAIHRRVGYVPGETGLYERMTGRALTGYLGSLRGGVDPQYVDRLAHRLDLDLDRPARALSKGNRQKLALVQALMNRPELLVLDEPTAGLDPLVQQQFQALLREHTADGGTVLLSSHVLDEVQRTADRVGIIRAGHVIAVERLDSLRAQSMHHVSATLAGPVDPSRFTAIPGVRDLRFLDGQLTCSAPQSALDALVKEISRHEVLDLGCEEAGLEETFLAYYGEEVTHAAA
jgi:ABC-2 type transport system ATP-binding protein